MTQQSEDTAEPKSYHSPLSHAELRMWVGGRTKPQDPNYVLTIDGSVLPCEVQSAVEDEIERRWKDGLNHAEIAMWEQEQDPDEWPHEVAGVSCSGPNSEGRTGVEAASNFGGRVARIHWEGECDCVD